LRQDWSTVRVPHWHALLAYVGRVRLATRAGLVLVAAVQAEVGVWGLVSPHGFFTGFPGAGRHWVAPLGAYNEHLVRDYAAAELGLAVLLLGMALRFERRLVWSGGLAFLFATVPHLAYHLTTTDSLSAGDNAASLGGFGVEILVVAAAMAVVARSSRSAAQQVPERLPDDAPGASLKV
jgi:hypothetical protein